MVENGEISIDNYFIPGWADMEFKNDTIDISLYYDEGYKYTYNVKTKMLEKKN